MNRYGPNVTKLIIKLMSYIAIPKGGGIADGIEFFRDAEHRKQILAEAEAKALASIQLVKTAPDNPFGNDEEIAAEILKRIKEKEQRFN